MAAHPIVYQGIPRSAVASVEMIALDQGHIRDASYIEYRHRLGESRRTHQRSMIGGRQWRTLATVIQIVLPKLVDHHAAQRICQALTVAQLPASTILRLVLNRLAMKADEIDPGELQDRLRTELSNRMGM